MKQSDDKWRKLADADTVAADRLARSRDPCRPDVLICVKVLTSAIFSSAGDLGGFRPVGAVQAAAGRSANRATADRLTLSVGLHPGRRVDGVSKQTVPGHLQAHHAGTHGSCKRPSQHTAERS